MQIVFTLLAICKNVETAIVSPNLGVDMITRAIFFAFDLGKTLDLGLV